MYFIRCSLRRSSTLFAPLRTANACRFMASSQRKPPNFPHSVLDRVTIFINDAAPYAIPGYFKKRMAEENISRPLRRQASEAVLDLLLRRHCFDEAIEILHLMSGEGMRLSAPIRAKVLTFQFVNKMITRRTLFHNLDKLFQRRTFAVEGVADEHFHDLLHHLIRAENSIEVLKEVVDLYINKRGEQYRLDSFSVAFMITRYFVAGRQADAERWLDYHSERPTPDSAIADPAFCYPYAAFARALLAAAPNEDPRIVYGPILDRMARDYAWPDTAFINILITAELRHMHTDRALALYDTLRSHTARGVYPDETTYSQLFVASERRAIEQREADIPEFSIPPRTLFREMLELHTLILTERIAGRSPVLTKASLGAALCQFVASGDYAGAIITLRTFRNLHVPLEYRIIRKVIGIIVDRCQYELKFTRTSDWANVFLDLRGIPKSRTRGVSEWEMTRRVISVARRALALAEQELFRALKERASDPIQSNVEAEIEQSSESGSESVSETPSADREVETEPSQEEGPSISIREEKKDRMRSRRIVLLDVLLARALETSKLVKGSDKPSGLARKEVMGAAADMVPDMEKLRRGTLDETRMKNATSAHES